MFIDKEEEEKKAKELEKNAVAITWDLLSFEDVWSFNQAFGKGKLENSEITYFISLKTLF